MGVLEPASNDGGVRPHWQAGRAVRFGPFELRPNIKELRRNGVPIKIQPKPLLVLCALVEHAGELVTREALSRRLWPDGTFVDFESGLNTATNRLRTALGDSVEHPVYIQTVSRLGYRFICPVEVSENPQPKIQPKLTPFPEPRLEAPNNHANRSLLPRLKSIASWPRSYYAALLLIVLAAILALVIFAHSTGLNAWSQAYSRASRRLSDSVQFVMFLWQEFRAFQCT